MRDLAELEEAMGDEVPTEEILTSDGLDFVLSFGNRLRRIDSSAEGFVHATQLTLVKAAVEGTVVLEWRGGAKNKFKDGSELCKALKEALYLKGKLKPRRSDPDFTPEKLEMEVTPED